MPNNEEQDVSQDKETTLLVGIPAAVKRRFKAHCALVGVPMGEAITELMKRAVAQNERFVNGGPDHRSAAQGT